MESYGAYEENGNCNKKPKLEIGSHDARRYEIDGFHFTATVITNQVPENMEQPKNLEPNTIFSEQEASSTSAIFSNKCKIAADNSKIEQKDLTQSPGCSNNANVKAITMLEKLEKAAPYNIFFTTIVKAPQTTEQPNAITFTDLLCPSLGALKNSLQITFLINHDWLLKQYEARGLAQKPLTLIYGKRLTFKIHPNVNDICIRMKNCYGVHHPKIGIYVYEDLSLRVVVSTANLYYEDWNHYNQGLWMSPLCPRLPISALDSDGESPTGFKSSLLRYLESYALGHLKPFIKYVQRADFSAVNLFYLFCAWESYSDKSIADLLSKHCKLQTEPTPSSEDLLAWRIIAQASSIGSMGNKEEKWLKGSLLRALASHKDGSEYTNSNAVLNLVYPSVSNVITGYFETESGGCLSYSKTTHDKQSWLQKYMHQWKAESYSRTRAMPHIKTYCRVSPCLSKLAYFLLTSANVSQAAWGGPFNKNNGVYVRSYEAGVLFLPKFFDEEYFELKTTVNRKNVNLFPFMYDLPLTPYGASDDPYTRN